MPRKGPNGTTRVTGSQKRAAKEQPKPAPKDNK